MYRIGLRYSSMGFMTAVEFRAHMAGVGLELTEAEALGISYRQALRYANAGQKIPGTVSKLLRLAKREGLKADDLREL
jgi:hypothetical protein